MKQSKNKGLTLKNKLKLSLSNFMERKWRNLLIATATSIGFIGVLISFGLGNAIVGMINDSTDGGNIPSQIQISLSAKSAARGVLNADAHAQKNVRILILFPHFQTDIGVESI